MKPKSHPCIQTTEISSFVASIAIKSIRVGRSDKTNFLNAPKTFMKMNLMKLMKALILRNSSSL